MGCVAHAYTSHVQRPRALTRLGALALLLSGCLIDDVSAPPRAASTALPAEHPRAVAAAAAPSKHIGLQLLATWNSLRGDPYPLDDVERTLDSGALVSCHPGALVTHRGKLLPYQGEVQVDPAFVERLVRFEQVVLEVAADVYGRAPARLRHFGAYSCRSARNRSARLSEHALGNAIDVVGFDFARARKTEPLHEGLPRELRGAFQVRVARHWKARGTNPSAAVHQRFLRELAERLGDRSDVFRGMIGPSRSDHTDHFHLDMGPWRYVYF
jgi:hypothetical protein